MLSHSKWTLIFFFLFVAYETIEIGKKPVRLIEQLKFVKHMLVNCLRIFHPNFFWFFFFLYSLWFIDLRLRCCGRVNSKIILIYIFFFCSLFEKCFFSLETNLQSLIEQNALKVAFGIFSKFILHAIQISFHFYLQRFRIKIFRSNQNVILEIILHILFWLIVLNLIFFFSSLFQVCCSASANIHLNCE